MSTEGSINNNQCIELGGKGYIISLTIIMIYCFDHLEIGTGSSLLTFICWVFTMYQYRLINWLIKFLPLLFQFAI